MILLEFWGYTDAPPPCLVSWFAFCEYYVWLVRLGFICNFDLVVLYILCTYLFLK